MVYYRNNGVGQLKFKSPKGTIWGIGSYIQWDVDFQNANGLNPVSEWYGIGSDLLVSEIGKSR